MSPAPALPSATLRLSELAEEARYARDRFRLYRARAYSGRPTSPQRLREFERRSHMAAARLDRARAEQELLNIRSQGE